MIIKYDPKLQLLHQIDTLYPGGVSRRERKAVDGVYEDALLVLDKCFSHVKNKYYHNNGETIFNPLHVAQWTMFLYQISHQLIKKNPDNTELCDKIYGISKMISSADIFYGVEMPGIFFFDHPQGSVMGRAQYADYFTFSQGCTVGNNKAKFPVFGKHVSMLSNSKVLGDCKVGDHVIFSANTYVLDMDIPSYSIVFGLTPNNTVKMITSEKFDELVGSMFSGDDE